MKHVTFSATFDDDFDEVKAFYAHLITAPDVLDEFLTYVMEEMIRIVSTEHLDGPVIDIDGHELRSFLICRNRFRVFYENVDDDTRGVIYLRHVRQER